MPRPLPVTLVTGFLGSGKTSLLHHAVTTHTGGHLALLVEKTDELAGDTRALSGLCSAMGRMADLVATVSDKDELAGQMRDLAQMSRHECVLLEVGGLTQASYWVRALRQLHGVQVQLEQVVCVVDLLDFQQNFLAEPGETASAGLRAFQQKQIEEATLLVLNKCDLADDGTRESATRLLRSLNPAARIIETSYGEIPLEEMFRAVAFSDKAESSAEPSPSSAEPPMPAFETVVYRAFKPFHPGRLWNWFNAPHAGLLRVKGLVWLATRNLLVGGISRTGQHNGCGAAGIWWAALPREEWPTDEAKLAQMQRVWQEPYGDRRQELVLIGVRGPTADAARSLNLCLLSAPEYAQPDWRRFPDPFPEWDLEGEGEASAT